MAILTLVEAEHVRAVVRHNIGVSQLPRSASPCVRVVRGRTVGAGTTGSLTLPADRVPAAV